MSERNRVDVNRLISLLREGCIYSDYAWEQERERIVDEAATDEIMRQAADIISEANAGNQGLAPQGENHE